MHKFNGTQTTGGGGIALVAAVFCAMACMPSFADENLIVNGNFETGDTTGWTTYGNIGVVQRGSAWISNKVDAYTLGTYGCYHQTHHTSYAGEDTYLQQVVTVSKTGTYRYSFYYAVRPSTSSIYGGVPFQVNIISPSGETNTVESITPSSDTGYPLVYVTGTCKLPSAGDYTFQILQPAPAGITHSYGNVYDNIVFSLDTSGNLIKNGTFDKGYAGTSHSSGAWGAASEDGVSIPYWETTLPSQTGLATAQGTWVAPDLEIGRYALYYQRNKTEAHTISQDFTVEREGVYRMSFKYTDRPDTTTATYLGFPFQLQLVHDGATNVVFSQASTFNNDTMHSVKAYVTLAAGSHTLQFYMPAYDNSATENNGTGIAFDDVELVPVRGFTLVVR